MATTEQMLRQLLEDTTADGLAAVALRDERIRVLEAGMEKAHAMLVPLCNETGGWVRRRLCTALNIIGAPIGKARSVLGIATQE